MGSLSKSGTAFNNPRLDYAQANEAIRQELLETNWASLLQGDTETMWLAFHSLLKSLETSTYHVGSHLRGIRKHHG